MSKSRGHVSRNRVNGTRWPIVSDDPGQQAHYTRMRRQGQSHNIAEMCALAVAPGTFGTEKAFWQGQCNENQFSSCPEQGEFLKRTKNRGQSVSGKFYHSQVGEWISSLDDLKAAAKRKRVGIEGIVNVKAPPVRDEFYQPQPLSKPIVRELVRQYAEERPHMNTPAGRKQLRREVLEKHTPSSKKHLIKD